MKKIGFRDLEAKGLGNVEGKTVDTVGSKDAKDLANNVHTKGNHDDEIPKNDREKITKNQTKRKKATIEISIKNKQILLEETETEAKDDTSTGRCTRSMNGAAPKDPGKCSRSGIDSGYGGARLRSQVPRREVERKGVT